MGMHSSTFKLLPKYKQRQIDEQLDLKGMNRTDGPGWYVTVEIIGPDGPEIYKVWASDAAADADYRHLRSNPPLSEHMAHDDLKEIASMLASRIAKAENPDAAFRSFTRNLMTEIYAAANLAQDETETPLERTLEALLAAMYAPKRRY